MAKNSKDRKASQPWSGPGYLNIPAFSDGDRSVYLTEKQEQLVIAEAQSRGLLNLTTASETELLRIRREIFAIVERVIRENRS